MRVSLIIILFFTGLLSVVAQNVISIEKDIEWEFLEVYNSKKKLYKPVNGVWDTKETQPKLVLFIPIKYNQVKWSNESFVTESVSASELNTIDKSKIPNNFNVTCVVTESRKKKYASISVNGIRQIGNSNNYERIIGLSGDLELSNKSQLQLKSFASNSAFASGSGDWYKVGVIEEGVYRIDYDYLSNIGAISSSINSDAINVFGNGVGVLSEVNSTVRYDDVIQNAIVVEDGNDGTFDQGDYFLFYGRGPHKKEFVGGLFKHESHMYCDTSYYFVNINSSTASPKRITEATLSSLPSTNTVSSFLDFAFVEDDDHNLGKSGREYYGDIFDVQTSYQYDFPMPNISSADSINITARFVGKSSSSTSSFELNVNGQNESISVGSSGSGTYAPLGKYASGNVRYLGSGNDVSIQIDYDKNGSPSARGWLDYIEVNVPRNLTMVGGQLLFNNALEIGVGNVNEMVMGNISGVSEIWEITDHYNVKNVSYTEIGSAGSFTIDSDSLRSFVAFSGSNFLTPHFEKVVPNQNLHGLGYAEMITIVPPEYLSAAQDLADFHLTYDNITTHIVTPEQIYNEYSSGMRDVTAIKHFLKMFYDRAGSDPSLLPKYCLLFGDATYDVRNRLGHNSTFIPTYESNESLSVISTYATDDYFAILSNTGSMGNSDLMDIAVGRLPVQSLQEAREMVDKIKVYSSRGNNQLIPSSFNLGNEESVLKDWRNVVCLVSDDEDNDAYFNDTELMEDSAVSNNPHMNIVKIHSDAFVESSTPGGERNYGAEEAIRQRVERGALLVNYIGHGGETGWSHERILTVPTIQGWTNITKLPVFMTATCEFSRYDDHDRTSGGEYVVLNPNGGGIALFTTTRLVYNSSNKRLNRHFHSLFYDKPNGKPNRVGDVYFETKELFVLNGGGDINYRKFTLLGDPAVQIALPEFNVVTDSLNGVEISAAIDTLKALSTITISGHITNSSGALKSDFNGVVYPIVYDKKSDMETLGNSPGSNVNPFEMWKNIVYKGKATITNGYFSFSFVVPQDISFQYGNTRISYYAENGSEDAQGSNEVPVIGGINTNAEADELGPEIELFMNDDNFVSGGITDESPSLYARVFDDNGINMVGNGVGHNIEAVLDSKTAESIILNDYYEADLDTYKSGEITYPFSELETGRHTLSLKVWDVYNNSAKSEIEFVVAKSEKLALDHILNYPNPFTTRTEFYFEHNQVGDFLDVQIQVFTIAGKMVKTISQRVQSEGYRSEGIVWDGLDDYGDKIGRGVYVYKLKVMNERGEKVEKFEKLVILN